jgi:hypothetical protein
MDRAYALRLVVFEYLIPQRRLERVDWLRRIVTTGTPGSSIYAIRWSIRSVQTLRAQVKLLKTHIVDCEEGYDTWAERELRTTERLLCFHFGRLMETILLLSDALLASGGHATSFFTHPGCALSYPICASLNVRAIVDCDLRNRPRSFRRADPVAEGGRTFCVPWTVHSVRFSLLSIL